MAVAAVDGKNVLAGKIISKNIMKKMSPAKPPQYHLPELRGRLRRQEKKEMNKNFAPLRLGGKKIILD